VVTNPTWCSFFASQWYLYWFSKQLKINRHVTQHLSTSGSDSVEINLFVWDDGHPVCWLRSAESWLWQKASTHHVTVWYSNPLSHFLHTTPTVLCAVTTSRLYFDTRAIFQVCRYIRVQCYDSHDCRDLTHALCLLTGQDTDSIHLKHGLQVTHAAQMVTLRNVLQVLQQCCQSHSFNPHT
jgi:hypothetical protein